MMSPNGYLRIEGFEQLSKVVENGIKLNADVVGALNTIKK